MIERVVSGGQTGVDRWALDEAMGLHVHVGGWCPRGRRAEDGAVPDRYPLRETGSAGYGERTYLNVVQSDATLVVAPGGVKPRSGTALTLDLAADEGRPAVAVDSRDGDAARVALDFLRAHRPRVLNVAGPRESRVPRDGDGVRALLRAVLARAAYVRPTCACGGTMRPVERRVAADDVGPEVWVWACSACWRALSCPGATHPDAEPEPWAGPMPRVQVVNVHHGVDLDAPDVVYCGRAGHGRDGYLGNPIVPGRPCRVCGARHEGRDPAIVSCHRRHLYETVGRDAEFRRRLLELRAMHRELARQGQALRLACFCAPRPCHADSIAEFVDCVRRA